jgi:hypothetical protein
VYSKVQVYGPRGNFNPFSNSEVIGKLQEKIVRDFGPTFEGINNILLNIMLI